MKFNDTRIFISAGYEWGGVQTNSKRELTDTNKRNMSLGLKDMHCLYPGDLNPFLRKPLFLIVDSDNSSAFSRLPRNFGQPLLVLMSPEEYPSPFHDHHKGSLFTLFLHSPLTAICYVSNIIELPVQLWQKGNAHIDRFLTEAGRLLAHSRNLDPVYLSFYGDDFLRLIMLRYIFCCVVLRMHRLFKVRNSHPEPKEMLTRIVCTIHPYWPTLPYSLIIGSQLFSTCSSSNARKWNFRASGPAKSDTWFGSHARYPITFWWSHRGFGVSDANVADVSNVPNVANVSNASNVSNAPNVSNAANGSNGPNAANASMTTTESVGLSIYHGYYG